MGHGMKQRKKSVKRGEVQYSLSLDVSSWGMKNGLESNYEHLGIAVIQKALEDYVELLRQRAHGKLPRKSRGKFTAETYELLEAEAFLKENRCQAFLRWMAYILCAWRRNGKGSGKQGQKQDGR